jgi:hypothetical protein
MVRTNMDASVNIISQKSEHTWQDICLCNILILYVADEGYSRNS